MKNFRLLLFSAVLIVASKYCFAQQYIENFETFLKKYSDNFTFQKERTKYPLPYVYFEYEYDEDNSLTVSTNYISAKDWKQEKIANTDSVQIDIHQNNDACEVFYRGRNCGIYIIYYFNLYNDKWYLTKIEDHSD